MSLSRTKPVPTKGKPQFPDSLHGMVDPPRTNFILQTPMLFPECYRTVLKETFGNTHFSQIDSFIGRSERKRGERTLIVLDGLRNMDSLSKVDLLLQQFPNVSFALATEGLPARSDLERYFSTPYFCSLLPMDVRLDLWLSSVRIIIDGHEYVPANYVRECFLTQNDRNYLEIKPVDSEALATTTSVSCPATAENKVHLTDREGDVLELVADGTPNKLIADRLDLSEHTVKLHVHRVIKKLGVRNRTEAASLAHKAGILRKGERER